MAGFIGIGLGVIAAILLSSRVQRVIAHPIEDLSTVASRISKGGDYSLRATKQSEDEVGQLVDTFNAMLAEIERRDEQLRAAGRLKDEFLAALSHELRTPLNAVLGWIQVPRSTRQTRRRAQRASSIERNARAQASLIEDLLDISRIVSGKLTLKSEPVDLTAVIDAALEVVRPAAEAKGITIVQSAPCPRRSRSRAIESLPDRLESAVERREVQSRRRGDQRDAGVERRSLSPRGARRWHRHRAGVPDACLRSVPPGRWLDHAPCGGLGLGLAIARELTGSTAARSGPRARARPWLRFTVELPHRSVHDAPPQISSAHPMSSSKGCPCSSWTTTKTRAT